MHKPLKQSLFGLIPSALSLVLVDFFWIASAWPGTLSPDSIDTWNQIQTGEYTNWHPVIFQAYVYVLSFGGQSVGLYSILQLLTVTFGTLYIVGVIFPFLHIRTRIWLVSAAMATPFLGQMSMQMWKDIPFAIFSLIGLCILSSNLQSRRRNITGIAVFSLGISFRHEGLINALLCVSLVLVILALKNKHRAKNALNSNNVTLIVKYASTLLLVSFLFPLALSSILDAKPNVQWASDTSFLHDLGYSINVDKTSVSNRDREIIQKIISGNSFRGTKDCSSIDPMMYSDGFNPELISQNDIDIKNIWMRNFHTAWPNFLYVRWCTAKAYLPIPLQLWKNPVMEREQWKVEWLGWGVTPNTYGIVERPLISSVAKINYWWRGLFGEFGGLIAWPGLHLTFLIASRYFLRKKIRFNIAFDLVLIWIVSRHLLFTIAGTSPGYRFLFVTHILSLLTLGMILQMTRDKNDKRTPKQGY